MSTAAERGRTLRTCVRCGRTGYNAFEPVTTDAGALSGWACTHHDPCVARRRAQWRAGSRVSLGRPRSSPLLAWAEDGQKACIIGADASATGALEALLRQLTPLEVDTLDHSRRAMTRLSQGSYCLVVVDAGASDPLAYCNELVRRLSSANRRQVPIVICADADVELRPPLRDLLSRPAARLVERPVAAPQLSAAVADALGWVPGGEEMTA